MKKFFLFSFMVLMIGASFLSKPVKADISPEQLCYGTYNGRYGYQYCAGVGDIGYYVTTRGDLKYIKCNLPGYPIARQCFFMPALVQ